RRPRFTSGPAKSGYATASCLNSSSASVLRPDFIRASACAYCCAARSGTGVAGTGAVAPLAVAGPAAAPLPGLPDAALGAPAVLAAGAGTAALGWAGLGGALWQPA